MWEMKDIILLYQKQRTRPADYVIKFYLKPNKPACECLDCIEEYLNHPLATNLSLELEVRNHLFDSL